MRSNERKDRVGDEVRRILSEVLLRRINDHRLEPVSLTDVKMSRDLSHANVYYSVLGDEAERAEAREGFEKAGGFLRRELGSQLRLRKVPQLHFIEDRSIAHGMRMDALIDRVLAEDERMREAADEHDGR